MFTALRIGVSSLFTLFILAGAAHAEAAPQWIWNPVHELGDVPPGACHFRGTFQLAEVTPLDLDIGADDSFQVYINGKPLGRGKGWQHLTRFDLTPHLTPGKNVVAVKVVNQTRGDAGLVARVRHRTSGKVVLVSDRQWRTYTTALPKWNWVRYADAGWKSAREIGPWPTTGPWLRKPRRLSPRVPTAELVTPPERARWGETIQDVEVMLTAGQEEVPEDAPLDPVDDSTGSEASQARTFLPARGPKPGPLLLRPLEALGLKKKTRTSTVPASTDQVATPEAVPMPAAEPTPKPSKSLRIGPLTIHNPFVKGAPAREEPEVPRPPQQVLPKQAVKPAPPKMALPAQKVTPPSRFSAQKGFEVELVVGHARTGSLIAGAFNEFGQFVASQEDGPLLLLTDSDGDGRLDQTKTYGRQVTNCHGVLALSGMVFVIGQGPEGTGLYRLRDADADGELDDVKTMATFDVSRPEHGPHGLVLGPDSKIYLVVGNHATLRGKFSHLSPRRHLYEGDLIPRHEDPGGHANGIKLPAGCVIRTDVNGENFELFASGLRNAYDLTFNTQGDLFTADADMESDSGSHWYRPTRAYHVLPGSEFGWRSGWSKWPAYYHDAVPPLEDLGRGSPTGVVCYDHRAYPEAFRRGLFLADWSEGRILFGTLRPQGAGYEMETDVFLSGKPLNVTDLEVGPDGMLYFLTGGRSTSGGLYRVRYTGTQGEDSRDDTALERALTAPQIHSSWGRQQVAAIRLELGDEWDTQIREAVRDPSMAAEKRCQGLQLMQWMGPLPDADLLLTLSRDAAPDVRRRAAYLMSTFADQEAVALRLLELLSDPLPPVRRQACESLVRANRSVPFEYVAPLLKSRDRSEAWSGRRLVSLDDPESWQQEGLQSTELRTFIQSATALIVAWPSHERGLDVMRACHQRLRGYVSDEDFVDLLRVMQLAVVRGGLQPADVLSWAPALAEEFPANDHTINRELLRLLVGLQVTGIKQRYLDYLDADLSPADRIHVVTHLRFLDADWTSEEKQRLFAHMTPAPGAGSGIAGYLQNLALELGKSIDPMESAALLAGKDVNPTALLAAIVEMRDLSAEQIKSLTQLDGSLSANDEMTKRVKIAILAVLARDGQEAGMAHLRQVYEREPNRRLEVAIGLAEQPGGANWHYLVRSLPLLEGELAREMLQQLMKVDRAPQEAQTYADAIALGEKLGPDGALTVVKLLEHWQGYASSGKTPPWEEAIAAWKKWFAGRYPDYETPAEQAAWDYEELVAFLDEKTLAEASAQRGEHLFHQAQCVSCHRHGDQGESMGPDLTGLARRFRTKEILESIVHPSRVISDQYRSKTLVTEDGQAYTGIVGYGGDGALLVLEPTGKKVRVASSRVVETVPSPLSAMPEALVESYTRQQIADLVAFLKSDGSRITAQDTSPTTR